MRTNRKKTACRLHLHRPFLFRILYCIKESRAVVAMSRGPCALCHGHGLVCCTCATTSTTCRIKCISTRFPLKSSSKYFSLHSTLFPAIRSGARLVQSYLPQHRVTRLGARTGEKPKEVVINAYIKCERKESGDG